ncbi:hypothetical protein INT45_010189 [Circinella minor]|uniref:Uncharacterized protein n=1 Tax=Circinella minor TaxID=1195481 RepID=A0A8H7VN94_9FUNG|nr:hypothetical protein INT45_010189 [Circinella minor]
MKKWIGLDYLAEDLRMYSACPTFHAIYPLPGPQNCTNSSRRMNGTLCDTPLLGLFMRESFEEKIEQWKSRHMEPGLFNDVYDGMMWYYLLDPSTGLPFVETPRSLMLTLNIDWFAPFDSEPSTYEINCYLEPLVDSLLRQFNGITIPTYQEPNGTVIRAALLNIACGIN